MFKEDSLVEFDEEVYEWVEIVYEVAWEKDITSHGYSLTAVLLICSIYEAHAQINTPCTSSMITTFTPCLSYVARRSVTGSSPTADCCNSLKSLMSDSMDCTCLIITGNVPLSIPFVNRNLAISLPRMCQSSVPVQCKASGVPMPAPGPALFGPTSAPSALAPQSHSPKASKSTTDDDQELDFSPASTPESQLDPSANPGMRPVVQPNSASNSSYFSFLMLMGAIVSGIL